MRRRGLGKAFALLGLLLAGCTLAPRKFRDLVDPAPLVRARAVSLGDDMPTEVVVPALIERLDDLDPVVRLSAHEELKRRSGHDFGYRPWDNIEDRQRSVARWRSWWQGLNGSGPATPPS